ncbi:MAG TPA: beta-1,6-N-acetylglucosaminyltransferase [Candidatus Saccharimonadales bacterium]|nr:beta-1,6-N-acetylglucosaminyltransferase [Candidatus Saccharimonadales bacterium]
MKIAYLIMANKNPNHLNRLLQSLQSDTVDFFIHIDKKSRDTFFLPKFKNIKILKNSIPVYWGGFSQVDAAILLMKEAKLTKKYDYYILLSGSDYPVKSNTHIHNYLLKNLGKEFINICKMPLNGKTWNRIEYFHFEGSENKIIACGIQTLNKMVKLIKRNYPKKYSTLTLYGGSTWWALTDKCIEYILQFIKDNPDFIHFYKYTLCSDEMFFQTILGNSPFKKNITNALTYTDWESKELPLPAKITKRHIAILKEEFGKTVYGNGKFPIFFARKFSDESLGVVSEIEKVCRS